MSLSELTLDFLKICFIEEYNIEIHKTLMYTLMNVYLTTIEVKKIEHY